MNVIARKLTSSPVIERGEDRVWLKAVDGFTGAAAIGTDIGTLLARLNGEAAASLARTGRPPSLRGAIWSLRKRVDPKDPSVETQILSGIFAAFDRISSCSFQTLQAQELFKNMLASEGLTADGVATSIWVDWFHDRAACPVLKSYDWLNQKHWDLGLGWLFEPPAVSVSDTHSGTSTPVPFPRHK